MIPLPQALSGRVSLVSTGAFLDALKTGFLRDRIDWEGPAYTVAHGGHYVSARWPGDAFTFGKKFLALLRAASD